LLYGAAHVAICCAVLGLYSAVLWAIDGLPSSYWGSLLVYGTIFLFPCAVVAIYKPSQKSVLDGNQAIAMLSSFIVFVPILFASFFSVNSCILFDEIPATHWQNFYFSFLTFSTLGYGDGLPNDYCKLPAVLESLLGLVSLAFIIALAMRPARGPTIS